RPPRARGGCPISRAHQMRIAPLECPAGCAENLRHAHIAPDLVVQLEGITKRFAGHTAVDQLSLSIPKGVIFGLLGPNGAGKSTTIRIILDILRPDVGSVRLFGDESGGGGGGGGGGRDHTARIGYLPEERGLYRKMRVLDVLVFLAQMKGVERSVA